MSGFQQIAEHSLLPPIVQDHGEEHSRRSSVASSDGSDEGDSSNGSSIDLLQTITSGHEEVASVALKLPWEADGTMAMALRDKSQRKITLQKMRTLLLQPPSWITTVQYLGFSESYSKPYRPRAELMVQMLVSVLCRKASRRRSKHHSVSDDPFKLAAGLRMHKSEKAFSGMADDFEHYIDQLDDGASMNKFFDIYGAIETWTDVVPGLPVQMKHLKKQELGKHLDVMHLTLGNRRKARERKARERATAVKAQIAKAKGRWNVLSSLLAPEDADEEGSAIARKLRSVMQGGQRLRLMPSIADLATVVVQKEEAEQKEVIATLHHFHDIAVATAGGVDDSTVESAAPPAHWKETLGCLSMYNRCHYAFEYLASSTQTDRVYFKEYCKRRKIAFKILDVDIEMAGSTPREEFEALSVDHKEGLGEGSAAEKHVERSLGNTHEAYVSFKSLSSWFRREMDGKAFSEAASVGPPDLASPAASTPPEKAAASLEKDGHDIAVATAGGVDDSTVESAAPPALWKETLGGLSMPILNRSKLTGRFSVFEGDPSLEEKEDATGLLVDIDVFCDLVLQCHYKTRSAGIVHLIR